MTKIINTFVFLFLFILFLGCDTEQNIKLEQNIYNNLFEILIDSTITDYRKLTVPSLSDFENAESIEGLNKRIEEKKQQQLSSLIIYVKDTLNNIEEIDFVYSKIKNQLSNIDYQSIINNSFNESKEFGTIKIESLIVEASKYELKHDSMKLKDEKLLKGLEKNRISATYHLSRVYFNKEKMLGIFTLSIVHGRLNAIGVIVIVKKENNKWVIKKIIENWVS